jgi:hypothetical protein
LGNTSTSSWPFYSLPLGEKEDKVGQGDARRCQAERETFFKSVEVFGSPAGPKDGHVRLARGALSTHAKRGEVTELSLEAKVPVQWVKLRLSGGIDVRKEKSSFEFSEIIGNGKQELPSRVERFHGAWPVRGGAIALRQEGATVTGCYDDRSELSGTVTGNILRARGVASGSKVVSLLNRRVEIKCE